MKSWEEGGQGVEDRPVDQQALGSRRVPTTLPPTPGREKLAQAPLELETFVTISLLVLVNVPRT